MKERLRSYLRFSLLLISLYLPGFFMTACTDVQIFTDPNDLLDTYISDSVFVRKVDVGNTSITARATPGVAIFCRESVSGSFSTCQEAVDRLEGIENILQFKIILNTAENNPGNSEDMLDAQLKLSAWIIQNDKKIESVLIQEIAGAQLEGDRTVLIQFPMLDPESFMLQIEGLGDTPLQFNFNALTNLNFTINCDEYDQ